jgi:hypothetical protein
VETVKPLESLSDRSRQSPQAAFHYWVKVRLPKVHKLIQKREYVEHHCGGLAQSTDDGGCECMDQCRRQRTAKDQLSGAKTRRNKSARERKAVKRRALATVGIRRARGEAPKKEQIRAPLKKAGGQAGEEETEAGETEAGEEESEAGEEESG